MNRILQHFLGSVVVGGISFFSLITPAYSAVQRISWETATGNSGTPVTLEITPGYGLNISFIPLGETIEKVWLDDPSWLTVDADGCLQGLSRNCNTTGATVLHLRRIQELDFPGLAQSPNQSTLLTVITRNFQSRRVYVFRIQFAPTSESTPQYHTLEVVNTRSSPSSSIPSASATASEPQFSFHFNESGQVDSTILERIERGVQVSLKHQWMQRNSPIADRIAYFIKQIKQGISLEQAQVNAQISVALINRLYELGNSVESTVTTEEVISF